MQTCCSTVSPFPTKHLKSFKAQSFTLWNMSFDYIQVSSFLKDEKKETNKTSPVNRDSLLQKVFAPNPFHFRSVKYQCFLTALMVIAHFKDSVCLSSRGKGRERRGERDRAVGSSGNPPSITGEPIIKDKLQYTSLGYANSKLDASHQKISIAIFCIYKLKMSAFS